MIYIFYSFGILVFLSLFVLIFNFSKFFKVREWHYKFKKVVSRNPFRSDFRTIEDFEFFQRQNLILFIEIFWILIGFLTSQWKIFLLIILLNIVIKYFCKLFIYTFLHKTFSFLFLIARIFTYGYLILQQFKLISI